MFEAAWALRLITSGKPEDIDAVVKHGAIPLFVKLSSSPREEIVETEFIALGNIACDSPKNRDLILGCRPLPVPWLSQLMKEDLKLSVLRSATWALPNFCGGKPQPAFDQVEPEISVLAALIQLEDGLVLEDVCWTLSYMSCGPRSEVKARTEIHTRRC